MTLASFLHCLSIGHPSWFNILETDEYLEKSFNANLAALLLVLQICTTTVPLIIKA